MIQNTLISNDIINLRIRRAFLEAIYESISNTGEIQLKEVTQVVNYECKICGWGFKPYEYDALVDHLTNDHLITRDKLRDNIIEKRITIGYIVPDKKFEEHMKKYAIPLKTRIDRFNTALKWGALFNQESLVSGNDGIEWIVKPEIVRCLSRVKVLTRELTRTLERTY